MFRVRSVRFGILNDEKGVPNETHANDSRAFGFCQEARGRETINNIVTTTIKIYENIFFPFEMPKLI